MKNENISYKDVSYIDKDTIKSAFNILKQKYSNKQSTFRIESYKIEQKHCNQSMLTWIEGEIYYGYDNTGRGIYHLTSDDSKLNGLNSNQLSEYIYNSINKSFY